MLSIILKIHFSKEFNHFLLVGGNPYTTTSIYSLIHYLEKKWGIFLQGGTGELVEKLTELMERHGIIIKYNTEVEKLSSAITELHALTPKQMKNNVRQYNCNADPPVVYKNLLKVNQEQSMGLKKWFPSRLTNYSIIYMYSLAPQLNMKSCTPYYLANRALRRTFK